MDMPKIGNKTPFFLLMMSLILLGCVSSDLPTSQKAFNSSPDDNVEDNVTGPTHEGSILPKVELRHLIEPNLSTESDYSSGTGFTGGGSYVRKLTLPKNYHGRLYLAGINVGTLADRHVRVRFNFGVGREPVIISGTVSQAPGITPQTGVSVIILNLKSEPFRNVRLPYDLFDYNEYDFSSGDTPTQDNRNTGLYCRGLRIEDDPTFTGVGACDGAESTPGQPDEECLYAYAKVMDQGLIQQSNGVLVPLTPSLPQVQGQVGSLYYQEWLSEQLKKPLADTIPTIGVHTMGSYVFSEAAATPSSSDSFDITFSGTAAWNPVNIHGSNYYYRGPYRLINSGEWHFRFAELDGRNRLFKEDSWVLLPPSERLYYNSYMFPLATQLELPAGVAHLSSSAVEGPRSVNVLSTSGKTLWMDGANARAQSRNLENEHIGSCNVTSSIEILAKDNNGTDYVVAMAKDVKLQLVRPTRHSTDLGDEVLYSNFKTCASNAHCGGNECCFNKRCWDQSLVSQCFDPSQNTGYLANGAACTTDLECASLCCNRTSGQCAPHNTLANPPVLCNKPTGDYCLAKEWCQKSPVTNCYVIRTGTDAAGNVTCRRQCYVTYEYGDCKNGVCVTPPPGVNQPFDPSNPDCSQAVEPPKF